MDEYMRIALVTSGCSMLATMSLVGMGDIITKDAFEWLFSDPKVLRASTVIFRLMDDIVTHEAEQKRGHSVSAIECYMAQHVLQKKKHSMKSEKKLQMPGRI